MGATISSSHNPRFRGALALREGRERRARGLTLVDGIREIGRALESGARMVELWVAREAPLREDAARTLTAAEAAGATLVETSPGLLSRLAYGERDEPLVAVFETPATDLGALSLPDEPLIIVLEGVEKPGNLGAICRSADGAGADALIVADPVVDVWHPNAIRASLGTLFGMRIAVCTAHDALTWLRARGVRVLTARVDGAVEHDRADLTGALAIVLGSEAHGLSDTWAGSGVTAVRIPMLGRADSLNVSASAAVLLYESRRQRAAVGRA